MVMEKGNWDQDDLDQLMRFWRNAGSAHQVIPGPVKEKRAAKVLDLYADPVYFGEVYLDSLNSYYQVFFSEEERRIGPKLAQALERAKLVAAEEGEDAYLKAIKSRLGVQILDQVETVVLAPSYWCSPAHQHSGGHTEVVLFGARPKEESLVPGEIVPEDLLKRLKAMTDPTRMRILRYLIQEQLTPAELARRLRLRAPTVTHHLHTLKASGMVRFVKKGKNVHLYYAKMDSIKETYKLLNEFLEQDVTVVEGFDFFDNELI
jgi:DNA-binding transcriptional ArsR family regulator